jgi:diguanylate cyclase (GGDEF)-like protein
LNGRWGANMAFQRARSNLATGPSIPVIFFWVALVTVNDMAAAAEIVGSPPYFRFASDLDSTPQNFAIAQDSKGIVYVGNADGVIEFDGERWAITHLNNREIVRSVAIDANDRVYVGGYGSFGYLQRDPAGTSHFIDLTPKFKTALAGREFADIWNTLITTEGVYFRALRDVFFWDPRTDQARLWHHDGKFGHIARYHGETLLQFRGEGIKRRRADDWLSLPETKMLVNNIYGLIPTFDGGLLTIGSDGKWFKLKDNNVTIVNMPVGMPSSDNFQRGLALNDGSIALTKGDGQLYIVDRNLRFERHFKIDPGFLAGLAPAVDGGFWTSVDGAIYRIHWPAPWTVLNRDHGTLGDLSAVASWNKHSYILGSGGTQKMLPQPSGLPTFEPANWSAQVAYDLIEIDSQRALFADSYQLFLVANNKATTVSTETFYPRRFWRSTYRPSRIFVGTESGLRSVDVQGEKLTLSLADPQTLEVLIDSIAEISATELWFGTERSGLWHVQLDSTGTILQQTQIDSTSGLRLGIIPTAAVTRLDDGSLIVSTEFGFFKFTDGRFVADDLFGLEAKRGKEELLRIVKGSHNDLWAFSGNHLWRRRANSTWIEQPIQGLKHGEIQAIDRLADGNQAVVTTQSILINDPAQQAPSSHPPKVLLRTVARVLADGTEQLMPLQPVTPAAFAYGDFGLRFAFALPEFTQSSERMYQGRLVGYETQFSNWSRARGYTYSRLSPGAYSMQIRARDGDGNISEIVPYDLIILPPWYRTWWAYMLWAMGAATLLWQSTRWFIGRRTLRLANDKKRLETTVAERTQELASANARLEKMAHLDGLTGIANRRRLDEYLTTIWNQSRERDRPLAVIVIDVDHFKKFNDTHGHLAGDELLKNLVPQLLHCLRRTEDLIARYGGEEFLAILPGADTIIANKVAEAMREAVEQSELGATVSIGVASAIPNGGDAAELVQAADRALYQAKNNGRNRVVVSQ